MMDHAQRMLAGESLDKFTIYQLNNARKAVKNMQQDSIKSGDYLLAQRCEDVDRKIQAKLKRSDFIMTREIKDDCLIERLNDATDEFNETTDKANYIMDTFEKRKQDSIRRLEEKQKQEMDEFNENHTYEKMLPKFLKYSQAYLNLKFREKSLVSSKRFIEADALNKQAKELQEIEDQQHRENWDRYVGMERAKLQQKHANQMSALVDKWEKDKSSLLPSIIKTRENQTRAIEAIQNRRSLFPPPTRKSQTSHGRRLNLLASTI